MKKYVSLFALWARHCVYKFLALLLALAAAEAGVFLLSLPKWRQLELALQYGHIGLPLAAAFFALCALLCATGCQGSGKLGCTLARLRVRPWAAFVCHWAHNSLYFFLLWFAQVGIMLGLCALHRRVTGVDYGPQAVLLASYRVELFHCFLPLAAWGVYVRNCVIALSLGAATAYYSAMERRGKRGGAAIVLAVVTVFAFGSGGSGGALMVIFAIFMMAWCAVKGMGILEGEADADEKTA